MIYNITLLIFYYIYSTPGSRESAKIPPESLSFSESDASVSVGSVIFGGVVSDGVSGLMPPIFEVSPLSVVDSLPESVFEPVSEPS